MTPTILHPRSLADALDQATERFPTRPAVLHEGDPVTYRDLGALASRIGAVLTAAGCREGDRVAVLADNSLLYLVLHLTVPAHGRVVVPMNSRHSPAEVEAACDLIRPAVLVTDRPPMPGGTHLPRLLRPEVLTAALTDDWAGGSVVAGAGGRPDDIAAVFPTGGTTGRPKGVILSHANLVANGGNNISGLGLTPEDRWLVAAPMFHVAGVSTLVALVRIGATHVLPASLRVPDLLDAISRHQVTATLVVPTVLGRMVREQLDRPRDISSLRMLVHAGAPAPRDLIRQAAAAFPGVEIAQCYGATETASMCTVMRHQEHRLDSHLLGSCGAPADGVALRVVDDALRDLPDGVVGEVLVRGAHVMRGYWDAATATAEAFHDGWYRTGDLGRRVDGHLFVVDRRRDMIITGGENVYSVEVEDVLHAHPAVAEAAVYGVPHPEWGEAVHAAVVLSSAAGTDELEAHVRAHLAGYKVPRGWTISLDPLPRSGPGKVLKEQLRQLSRRSAPSTPANQ